MDITVLYHWLFISNKIQNHIFDICSVCQRNTVFLFIKEYLSSVSAVFIRKRISGRQLHGDGSSIIGEGGYYIFGFVCFAVMLILPVDGRQIVKTGLHGPDFVSLRRKGLSCVALHTDIYKQRLSVFVKSQASCVVVIVIIVVISGLHCQTESFVAGNEKPDAGVKNIPVNNGGSDIIVHNLSVRKSIQHSIVEIQPIGFFLIDFILCSLVVPGGKRH